MYLILLSIIPLTATKTSEVKERIGLLKSVLKDYDAELIDNPTGRSPFEDDFQFIQADIKNFQRDVADLDNLRQYRNFWLPYFQAINDARPIPGGVVISSIETMVIGGAKNTGNEYRNRGNDEEEDEDEGDKALQAENLSASATGMIGDLSKFLGRSRANQAQDSLGIIGFTGLRPNKIVEPNGFTIYGYAKNINMVREYVASLEEQGAFIEGGVYWDKAFSNDVPDTELDNAKTSGGGTKSSGSSSSGKKGGGLSSGSLGAGITASDLLGGASRNAPVARIYTGETVTSFHIDLQFLGVPQKQPK